MKIHVYDGKCTLEFVLMCFVIFLLKSSQLLNYQVTFYYFYNEEKIS